MKVSNSKQQRFEEIKQMIKTNPKTEQWKNVVYENIYCLKCGIFSFYLHIDKKGTEYFSIVSDNYNRLMIMDSDLLTTFEYITFHTVLLNHC